MVLRLVMYNTGCGLRFGTTHVRIRRLSYYT